LGERCSFVLSLFNTDISCSVDGRIIFERLKQAYIARSKLLHGEGYEKVQGVDIGTIVQYARKSLLRFYILCYKFQQGKKDKKVLNIIDNAIINHADRESLRTVINEGLGEFILSPPNGSYQEIR
jgi:hypothetical protein